jgi:hypothetical protein
LPVTWASWPARYFGAFDPAITPDSVVNARDVQECVTRLTGLKLLNGMSHSEMLAHFARLRHQCIRMVSGWPTTPNYAVELPSSADGAHAPQLTLRLVEHLQLAALSPYLARVLGLYFVDRWADPSATYDYCIVGLWSQFDVPAVLTPGSAPRGGLAVGNAQFGGLRIAADNAISHLYAWQRDDAQGNINPSTDPSAPAAVGQACTAALAGMAESYWPPSMLAAQVNLPVFPWGLPQADPVVCTLTLANPVADIAISIAGSGTVRALASATVVASGSFASPAMGWLTLAASDPASAPIDSLEITGNGGAGSVVVIAYLVTTPVANATIGLRYAMVHAPGTMPIPQAPATPVAVFRRRDAVAGPPGPSIRPRSLFDVQWVPAATTPQTSDPVTDPRTDHASGPARRVLQPGHELPGRHRRRDIVHNDQRVRSGRRGHRRPAHAGAYPHPSAPARARTRAQARQTVPAAAGSSAAGEAGMMTQIGRTIQQAGSRVPGTPRLNLQCPFHRSGA